jgi:hypothetical protein
VAKTDGALEQPSAAVASAISRPCFSAAANSGKPEIGRAGLAMVPILWCECRQLYATTLLRSVKGYGIKAADWFFAAPAAVRLIDHSWQKPAPDERFWFQ